MTSSCLICGTAGNVLPSIPKIIDAFRIMLGTLENQTQKLEKENASALKDLNFQLKAATERSHALEGEKTAAETRSDVYKKRFLEAQKAIQQLHEENIKLSSSQKTQQQAHPEDLHNFPFPRPSKSTGKFSPETKHLILAPDTCALVEEPPMEEVNYISSDGDDDFRQDSKSIASKSPMRSPRINLKKTPPKSVMDSFFIKPKSPLHCTKRKKVLSETSKEDLEETRLSMGDSVGASLDTEYGDLTVMDDHNAMDSIPPSPVLSGSKVKRFSSFRSVRGSIPKYSLGLDKENDSLSLLDPQTNLNHQLVQGESCFNEKEGDGDFGNSQSCSAENPTLRDSLPLHHLRQDATTSGINLGNTSLDELFNRTDGNLETTTVLHSVSYSQAQAQDETDEELDALLLAGVEEAETNQERVSARIDTAEVTDAAVGYTEKDGAARPMWNDSFDVLPKKTNERNYKYDQVVRKRSEREKLDVKACAQCEAFYGDLSEDERRVKMRKVCRHKYVHTRPSTPEHFWEVGIPSTIECRRRGYIIEEADLPPEERRSKEPRLRRKKPLQPFFNKKK